MAVVTLIVMEPGSEWPGNVEDSENVVAVGNDDEGLLARAQQKLADLRARGQRVRVVVLACSDTEDPGRVARRGQLADVLLSTVAERASGRLVLTAPERVSMRQRRALLTLAGELSHRVRKTMVTVSVRFGIDDRREIGLADGLGGEILTQVLRAPRFARAG